MLNQLTFANSLAVLTAALYVLFVHDRRCVASPHFGYFLNAQFFGANVASLKRERAT